jgi:hypothetical protein
MPRITAEGMSLLMQESLAALHGLTGSADAVIRASTDCASATVVGYGLLRIAEAIEGLTTLVRDVDERDRNTSDS